MTLTSQPKNFSSFPTRTMNIYGKLYWNPSAK